MAHRTRPLRIAPPPLSDQAAVNLLDFLHDLVAAFEARYFAQIHRFYEERSEHNLRRPVPLPPPDDDPF
jgi:hypothetical protein